MVEMMRRTIGEGVTVRDVQSASEKWAKEHLTSRGRADVAAAGGELT